MSTASFKSKLGFSSGNLAVNLLAQAFASYIVFYYVDVLGVRPALISAAMVVHGIVSAALNPLFGHLSDRTSTRWGRRIPYMLFGMVPLGALFTAVWFPVGTGQTLFWYFLTVVLLYDVMFVMVVLNYSALFPEMFTTIKERAEVSSWRQMFGIIGMIIGVALPPLVYGRLGWGPMGAVFAGIALLFFLVMTLSSRENGAAPREAAAAGFVKSLKLTFSNRAFLFYVTGSFFVQFTFAMLPAAIPFYTKYVLGAAEEKNTYLLGAIFLTAIPCVYVWGRLVQRWGPRAAVMASASVYAAALLPFAFIANAASAVIAAAAIGIGLAGLLVLLDVLLSEIIDEDENRTGVRREGMYFGMNGFIVKWGVSLQAVVLGGILEATGYVKDAVQAEAAVWGIRSMLSFIPFLSLAVALVFFYLYPIRGGISRPGAGKDLEA
ncbi:MFS transporter [Paenibacillus sp. N4]|uniref:MFS transporter n=1 Tax=Paenibacillus vietnamensis TaxID=2590547 RepID=UPI001CD11069|nr:MFS transporter [Paenibacillus vietnamensis]MCA0757451.1 MFS transporter [Paenibacillus vietnamensis]